MIAWKRNDSTTCDKRMRHRVRRSDETFRLPVLKKRPFTERPLTSEKMGHYWCPPYAKDDLISWKFEQVTFTIFDNPSSLSHFPH